MMDLISFFVHAAAVRLVRPSMPSTRISGAKLGCRAGCMIRNAMKNMSQRQNLHMRFLGLTYNKRPAAIYIIFALYIVQLNTSSHPTTRLLAKPGLRQGILYTLILPHSNRHLPGELHRHRSWGYRFDWCFLPEINGLVMLQPRGQVGEVPSEFLG